MALCDTSIARYGALAFRVYSCAVVNESLDRQLARAFVSAPEQLSSTGFYPYIDGHMTQWWWFMNVDTVFRSKAI